MYILLRWLIAALTMLLAARIVPGVEITSFWTSLWLVVFMALINAIIRPILLIITLPVNILTLGLFTFVINAAMVLLASSVVKGFSVDGFLSALVFSLVISLISFILSRIVIGR